MLTAYRLHCIGYIHPHTCALHCYYMIPSFLQVLYAFGRLESAMTLIITELITLAGLAAQTERLDVLWRCLQQPQQQGGEQVVRKVALEEGGAVLELLGVTFGPPRSLSPLCRVGGGGWVVKTMNGRLTCIVTVKEHSCIVCACCQCIVNAET